MLSYHENIIAIFNIVRWPTVSHDMCNSREGEREIRNQLNDHAVERLTTSLDQQVHSTRIRKRQEIRVFDPIGRLYETASTALCIARCKITNMTVDHIFGC
jgi:hypothetical protein